MVALLAAVISAATPMSNDDQQLVALTVTRLRGCLKLEIRAFTIYRGYAVGHWECGEGGGEIAAIKWDGRWIQLAAGGGAMGLPDLECQNVPSDIAKVLIAPCPQGHSHPLTGAHVAAGASVCTP